MKEIIISADGSCFGNPGPGGWAAELMYGKHVLQISGYDPDTTNNKMELEGVIEALMKLVTPCKILFRLDSTYVIGILTDMSGYISRGFKTTNGAAMKNITQVKKLYKLLEPHEFTVTKVDAHSGDKSNEWCDQAAKNEWKSKFQLLRKENT